MAKGQIYVQVPADATPGETKLKVEANGSQELLVTVPAEAAPEDVLMLFEVVKEDTRSWQISIVPAAAAQDMGFQLSGQKPQASGYAVQSTMQLRPDQTDFGAGEPITLFQAKVDPVNSYNRLVEAARANGGYVNEKIDRAAIPEIPGMVGMIATAPIEKGEVIAKMPCSLHIALPTVAAVMPELLAAVQKVDGFLQQFEKDMWIAACVTRLLAEAVSRIQQRVAILPEGNLGALWACYIDQLLGEDFSNHPYWHWIENAPLCLEELKPSPEGPHTEMMASDVLRSFQLIKKGVPAHLLGDGFAPGLFLHARLSSLSRVFHTCPEYASLVPIIDLFNHTTDPTCDWVFSKEEDAQILTANRAHAAGDQLWITYGMRPNTILFRTYGFTLPPSMEPSWSYILQGNKPFEVYERYLPEDFLYLALHLDTRLVQESVIDILNACAAGGHNAREFLFEMCTALREEYDKDPLLKPALAALKRAREKDASTAAWWDEMTPADSQPSLWRESCVSAKMSEYLCLTSYIEICEVHAGKLPKDNLLQGARTIGLLLNEAFEQLQEVGRFSLITSPAK
jgi:hypothetical protein